tara:strand:- start:41 stop:1219 length:1179 start_codon:yes stop_codon:yes gene_type:complete
MNGDCEKEWSRQFLHENFTQKFVNGKWKEVREKVLYEKELVRLPETQGVASKRKEDGINKEKMSELKQEIRERQREIHRLQNLINGSTVKMKIKEKNFVMACPSEGCRGYLDSDYVCGLCKRKTCKDCHVIMDVDVEVAHKCDENDVKSVALLKRDTKPCPKCSMGIFKISGCNQMWCTQCHTGFNWRTGVIEKEVHNPHYFEYYRQNGMGNGGNGGLLNEGNGCGETLSQGLIDSIARSMRSFGIRDTDQILRIVESLIHLQRVQLVKYRSHRNDNLELRIKFLNQEITQGQFENRLQRANKASEKIQELYLIMEMFHTTITDVLLRMNDGLKSNPDSEVFMTEICNIVKYTNKSLEDISKIFGSKKMTVGFYTSAQGRKVGGNWTRNVFE